MTQDTVTFRTGVPARIKTHMLKRGCWRAIPAVVVLALGGALTPLPLLTWIGAPLFLVCLGIITWGLRPYRALCLLENQPDKLIVDPRCVTFYSKNKARLRIPLSAITQMEYVEKEDRYGLAVWIDPQAPTKVALLDSGLNLVQWVERSRKQWNADLFFAHFTKGCTRELTEAITDSVDSSL